MTLRCPAPTSPESPETMGKHSTKKPKFEDALSELEEIVQELEDGEIDLETALQRYERGVALVRLCYEKLQEAEKRILQLSGQTDAGEPILKPFDHSATANRDAEEEV